MEVLDRWLGGVRASAPAVPARPGHAEGFPHGGQLPGWRLDCYGVGSLDLNFLVEVKGVSTKPTKSCPSSNYHGTFG